MVKNILFSGRKMFVFFYKKIVKEFTNLVIKCSLDIFHEPRDTV